MRRHPTSIPDRPRIFPSTARSSRVLPIENSMTCHSFAICDLRFAIGSASLNARRVRRYPTHDPRMATFRNHKLKIANRKSGFTLVEVLIAVAIALLLIVGISQIFAIAQRTTSMGTALLVTAAEDRSFQNTLNRDFRSILPVANTPGMVLASYSAAM